MTTHLEASLRRDAEQIRVLISDMASFGAETLRQCLPALDKADRQACGVIILRDQRMDHFEKTIDKLCLEFILRHQPAGSHLRFVSAALQINFQLERVGDYAESMARQILKLLDYKSPVPAGLLTDISSASISMFENAIRAFVREDPELASLTAQIEEQVDALRNQVNSELMHLVQSNQMPLAALTPLMTLARRFERVSDQAKGICQETLYICTGEYAKHTGSPVYRVVFVDENHGCLARLSEAVALSVHPSEFQFASAGIQPQTLSPQALRILARAAVPVSDPTPKAVAQAADLAAYDIVICLSPEAKRQLPAMPRKTVQLDWFLVDPCPPGQADDAALASLTTARTTVAAKLHDLVASIVQSNRSQPK